MGDLGYIDRTAEVKIAGQDSTGNGVNYVSADANGNMLVKDYSDGPVTPGTVASASALIGGQFNTALPTLTNGQQASVQVDSNGRLIIAPTTQGALAEDHNYGTVGATTLRTAAQVGNATGAADFNSGATGAQTLRVHANQGAAGATAWLTTDAADGPVAPGAVASKSMLIGGQFNTALPTLTNTQQSAFQLDSSGRLIIAPLANTSVVKAQLQDNAGNAINSNNNQLQVRDVINTSGQNRAQSVTTSAAEALGAATILVNRKFISLTPTNGTIYWGFANTVTTSSGTPIFKNQTMTIAATDNVHIYVIAGSTTDCRIAEGS
jgi:hypothetical protein